MSLQVWMPLVNDLTNRGLTPMTFSANQSMGITPSDGKLGSTTYYNNSQGSGGMISDSTIQLGSVVSMFCWVKLTSYETSGSSLTGLISNHSYNTSNGCGFGLTLRNTGSAFYVSVSTGPSQGGSPFSSRTYNTIYGGTAFYTNEWHHVGFTYDGAGFRLYLDGQEQIIYNAGTSTGSAYFAHVEATQNPANQIGIFNWSVTGSANYCPIGYINDARIYNHCLSLREIKELSKGKICHYQLKTLRPTRNNLKSDLFGMDNTVFNLYCNDRTNINGSVSLLSNERFMGAPIYRLTMTPLNSTGLSMIQSGLWSTGVCQSSTTFSANTRYCYWLYYRPVSDAGIVVGGVASNIGGWTAINPTYYKNGWYRVGQYRDGSVTTEKKDDIYTSFYFSNAVVNKPIIIDFAAPHLVAGVTSIQEYDGYFLSNPYTDREEDVSGNGNHGTIVGTLSCQSHSGGARYSSSYNFTQSQYISAPRSIMTRDQITVSIWAFMSNWSVFGTSNMRLLSCTDSGGWNFEPNSASSSAQISFAIATGTSTHAYKNATSDITLSNLSNNSWHLFTGTYDGKVTRIYIDGQERGKNDTQTSKTPIFYNSDNLIFLGAEANNTTTPDSNYPYFAGRLSDFRVYGTALSSADVLELYRAGAHVDNAGNMYSYEFKEIDI